MEKSVLSMDDEEQLLLILLHLLPTFIMKGNGEIELEDSESKDGRVFFFQVPVHEFPYEWIFFFLL